MRRAIITCGAMVVTAVLSCSCTTGRTGGDRASATSASSTPAAADGTSTTERATGDVAAACTPRPFEDVGDGGEFTDFAQFDGLTDTQSFDPATVLTTPGMQITNALYDGLTEMDYSDPCHPVVRPLVAKSFTANADSSMYAFVINEGLRFANGEPVLPSSFKKAWERAISATLATQWSFVFDFLGAEKLADGSVTTLNSIVANDDAMTLGVSLRFGASDFPELVSSPIFSPIAQEDVERVGATSGWGTAGAHIGNGPYRLESTGTPGGGSVVLVRNDKWAGNSKGLTRTHLDKITFIPTPSEEAAYAAFDARGGHSGPITWGQRDEILKKYPTTNGDPLATQDALVFGIDDPQVGGAENVELRRAISQAIDRDAIVNDLYQGNGLIADGLTPPGISGFKGGLCQFCATDPAMAKEHFKKWQAAGGKLERPVKIQAATVDNAYARRIQDNLLKTLGIETNIVLSEEFFRSGEGACEMCLVASVPNFPWRRASLTPFHSSNRSMFGGGNLNDREVDEDLDAMLTAPDPATANQRADSVENRVLNDLTVAAPLKWGTGFQAYRDDVRNYRQDPVLLIAWEYVGFAAGEPSGGR